jgi:hypothetical protein
MHLAFGALHYPRLRCGAAFGGPSAALSRTPSTSRHVQTQADVVELRVVPNDDFGDASRQALLAALRPVLPGVTLRIRTMPSIPSEPSGKYRIVKSELAPPAGSSGP